MKTTTTTTHLRSHLPGMTVWLALCLVLHGCASLTDSQIKSVNQFAETSKNFSAYPSKILTGLADIRKTRNTYFASSFSTPGDVLDQLDAVYKDAKDDLTASQKVDITFKIIDKYAQSLVLLSSEKHIANLEEQSRRFGTDLDSLVNTYNNLPNTTDLPTGIGAGVSKLIMLGGKMYIKKKQAEEIKKFVPQADVIIAEMTNNLLDFLQNSNIKQLIDAERKGLRPDFIAYLGNASQRPFPATAYADYLDLLKKVEAVESLQQQTIKATAQLRSAHAALLRDISTKKTLDEMIKEIKSLYEEVKEIKTTIQAIDKPTNN